MKSPIDRLKLIFLGIFAFACAGVLVYHVGWVWPGERCEAQNKWWDPQGRQCATPILISDITGRTIEDKRYEAAVAKAQAEQEAAKVAAGKAPTPAAAKAP